MSLWKMLKGKLGDEEFRRRWGKPLMFSGFTLFVTIAFVVLCCCFSPADVANSELLALIFLFCSILTFLYVTNSAAKLLILHPRIRRHSNLLLLGVGLWLLLARWLSLKYNFPSHLYATPFFTDDCYTLQNASHSLGQVFIDTCMVLYFTMLLLKYLTFHRSRRLSHRIVGHSLLGLALAATYLFFVLITVVIGGIVVNTNYVVGPNKLLFFDVDSALLLFVFFGFCYSYSLLFHKVVRMLAHFLYNKKLPLAVSIFGIWLLVALLSLLLCPTIQGVGMWLIMLLLLVYLLVGMALFLFGRKNFNFYSVLAKTVYFAASMALLIMLFENQKENNQRQQFLGEIIESTDEHPQTDSLEMDVLTRAFDEIYGQTYGPLEAWVSNSTKRINHPYINRSAQLASQYSFAFFVDDQLVDEYGLFDYKLNPKDYLSSENASNELLEYNGFVHYVYKLSDNEVLLISQNKLVRFDFWAAFAFYFCIYIAFLLFTRLLLRVFVRPSKIPLSLYNSILWVSLSVLLSLGIVACGFSLYYAVQHRDEVRREVVAAKTASAQLTFLRHGGEFGCVGDSVQQNSVNALLADLSKTYFAHFDLYDLTGKLQYSSNPRQLEKQTMLPQSVRQHFDELYSHYFVTQKEGDNIIYNLYRVVLGADGRPAAYMCAREVTNRYTESAEVSALLTVFMRVYALLIAFAVVASMFIYLFVSHSLSFVGTALAQRRSKNSPLRLKWAEGEEIGQLISEYNRRVEDIRRQAELLAKSERETAWREMAQEVAHEIKNPLTPMRLKMQMLQRAWNAQRPDFPHRIDEATDEVLRQINVLTEVADTFSEFAATQQSINKEENLLDILSQVRDLLPTTIATTINYDYERAGRAFASVDRKLFVQMMQYLYKNADHNRRDDGLLHIHVALAQDPEDERYWLLTFAANDRGLDDGNPELVFTVKFTAENCGHSLCLPIVKNIVVGFGGTITFATSREKGTKFFIRIPKV